MNYEFMGGKGPDYGAIEQVRQFSVVRNKIVNSATAHLKKREIVFFVFVRWRREVPAAVKVVANLAVANRMMTAYCLKWVLDPDTGRTQPAAFAFL
jgi:hypothetical protein